MAYTTQGPHEELVYYHHEEFVYIRVVACCVNASLGTVVNSAALAALLKYRTASAQRRLVSSLCVHNLLFCVLVLPFMAYSHLHSAALPALLPATLCRLHAYFMYSVQGMCLMSLLLIAFNRYAVVLGGPGFGGSGRTLAILTGCWAAVLLLLLPALLRVWGSFGLEPAFGVCTLQRSQEYPDKAYSLFATVLAFILPLTVMLATYARILWVVRKQNHKVAAHEKLSEKNRESKRKNEVALTLVSLRLVLVFIVLHLPFTLTSVSRQLELIPAFQAVATSLNWAHVLVNPALYVWGDTRLRAALLARLGKHDPNHNTQDTTGCGQRSLVQGHIGKNKH